MKPLATEKVCVSGTPKGMCCPRLLSTQLCPTGRRVAKHRQGVLELLDATGGDVSGTRRGQVDAA